MLTRPTCFFPHVRPRVRGREAAFSPLPWRTAGARPGDLQERPGLDTLHCCHGTSFNRQTDRQTPAQGTSREGAGSLWRRRVLEALGGLGARCSYGLWASGGRGVRPVSGAWSPPRLPVLVV